jgi:hypothetical protein
MRKNKKWVELGCLLLSCIFLLQPIVTAQSSSNNYKVEESYFGSGGQTDASSTNFRARQSTGAVGAGTSSSANFDAVAGSNTPNAEFLEVGLVGPNVDLGSLDPNTTSYVSAQGGGCNCTFYVRTYLSSSYTVVTASPTLTSENGDTIPAKAVQGAPSSSDSVAEFGINLRANTVPGAFGANSSNQPDDTFADGTAAPGYEIANQFKYGQGDIIAQSPATVGNPAVGLTNYTISYIAKSANLTPAGNYRMDQMLIVVPTF